MSAHAVISGRRAYSAWPELMKADTAAAYLDMSPGSFRNLVEEGVMPDAHVRRPGMVRWRKSDIDATLAPDGDLSNGLPGWGDFKGD